MSRGIYDKSLLREAPLLEAQASTWHYDSEY